MIPKIYLLAFLVCSNVAQTVILRDIDQTYALVKFVCCICPKFDYIEIAIGKIGFIEVEVIAG